MAVQESRLLISIDARNAERTAKALNSELQGITNNGAKADNQINAMGGSLKALAGYMGGILTIGSAIAMADGYTQMAARIRNATSSAQEYELVQERILETANGTYRSLSEAQEVYLSLAGGMKSLGKTTADTLDVADSLSYAFVANAARADQAQSAMDSLNKSMAKGKIDADAWISIVSAADNVIADMAKHTGKTEAQIRQLGATGKASLTDLLETLKATRDTNKQLADNMENSVADGFQKLTNSATVYLGKLNETSGATGVIAAALGSLGDNIDKVAVAGGVLASVMVGRVASGYAVATIAAIANASATAASAGAMATATTAARSLYIALGGPVGLAIAVAGAAASYLLLSNNAKDNTKSLRENNESVKDAISAYTQLDAVQKRAQLAKEKSDLKELSDSYENLTSKLNTNAYALSRHNDFTQAQSKEVNALIAEFKRTGDLDKFSASINKLSYVSQDSKDKFNALAGQVRTTGNEYKTQKQFIDAASNAMNGNAVAANNAAAANRNAAAAVSEYTDKLKAQKWDLEFNNAVIDKHGKSAREADLLLQAYRENEKKGIKGVTAEQKELIKGIVAEEKATQKRLESQRASASASAKASKKAQSDAAKEARQKAKDAKEAARDAKETQELVKEYSTDDDKRKIELEQEIKKLREHGLTQYIEIAKNRFNEESKLIKMKFEYDLVEFELSEEKKLRFKTNIREQEIKADAKLTQEQQKLKLDSLKVEFGYELAQIKLAKETRIFQAQQALMTETAAMNKRYELEEQAIMLIQDSKERAHLLELKRLEKEVEMQKKLNDARDAVYKIQSRQNGTEEFDAIYNAQAEANNNSANLMDLEVANGYKTQEQAQLEHLERMKKNAQEAHEAMLKLQFGYGEQIFGSLNSMFDKNDDRQKAFYRTTLALEKSFAIARSVIAIQSAIALAANNPFPMNLGAMATVAAQTASIVGNIKSVADGFYTGGYTGNIGTRDVAGVVHGQEYVLNAEATKRVGRGTLDALNNGGTLGGGGISVNIQNYGTSKAFEVQQLDANTVRIIARDEARNAVAADLQNPNSQISKAASQNLNAPRRRG